MIEGRTLTSYANEPSVCAIALNQDVQSGVREIKEPRIGPVLAPFYPTFYGHDLVSEQPGRQLDKAVGAVEVKDAVWESWILGGGGRGSQQDDEERKKNT